MAKKHDRVGIFGRRGAVDHLGQIRSELLIFGRPSLDISSWLARLEDQWQFSHASPPKLQRENTAEAIPVMAADMRLDFYYGFGGIVAPAKFHGVDMMRKKLEILESEINQFLPLLARRCGVVLAPFEADMP